MITYLEVSDGSLGRELDVSSYGWATEGAMGVFFLSHEVSAVWLRASAETHVCSKFNLGWLTVDASGCVPGVSTLNVLDTVHEISSSWDLTLSEVLGDTQEVLSNCLLILHSLLDNDCLWVLLLWSFVVNGHSSTV